MQRIIPFLWFDDQAVEAATFYTEVFPNSSVTGIMGPADAPMGVDFVLDGLRCRALNGGPVFSLTEAFSMWVTAETQEEIDYYWSSLTAGGGEESQCGWLKDRFGLSWQIVPPILEQLLADPDPGASGRVMQAMLGMRKLVIADLLAARDAA
ncbi:VOC family protein [Galbitalea soli]|uniref:VOC family protein n=1 Tax=Galbitalea soli TaxID=1268042 RepID=A0A7C9TPZ8_9MICO|nr:VOC family protein [Galbitalea soli]NEM89963.1 VOC family protein [Galbitalea soli]NYJ30669.1 putative 3-demethylubiquinone-9 3-methyltransferase (glyoxalase superfamily) [Galbitalea soli]